MRYLFIAALLLITDVHAQLLYSVPSATGETWIDHHRGVIGEFQPNDATGGRMWVPGAQAYPQAPQMPYGYGGQPNMLQQQLSPYSAPQYWPD